MKSARQVALSTFGAALSIVVLALGLPAFSMVASATSSNYTASAIDGAIPATLDGITLTQAPSFGGADDGAAELRSTISTYLGTVRLNHTGAFYGRAGSNSDFCYVGCSIGGAEQAFSLTFTLPAGTTAFAVRLNPSDNGATTYTVSGPEGSTQQFVWGGLGSSNESARPYLAVSARNGATLDAITITATQSDGCTYNEAMMGPQPCSLYGLDIGDVAIGDGLTTVTTTTQPGVTTDLASTGSNASKVILAGSMLVLMGAASRLAARRRSSQAR